MSLLVIALAPMLISCVSNGTFYIVTSSKSHCPREFIGQPCFTLEQYASHVHNRYSSSNNIILMIESGNHFLQSSQFLFGKYSRIIMNAEYPGAKTIFATSPISVVILFYVQNNIQMSGITFIGSSVHIEINYAQEVLISNCSFQGVSISLIEVNNALLSRCTFSDYRRYHRTDGLIIFGQNGALSIHYLTTVKIIQSNFTNNEVALYGQNYYSSRHVLSLHIQECIFSNNTSDSEFKGGAMHLAGHRDNNHVSISVNRSIFFNNTANESGGAIYVDFQYLDFSIIETSFIQNSAESCGALNILRLTMPYYNASIAQITGTTLDSNKANTDGGALCLVNTSAVISNCTFIGNTAEGLGGAVYHMIAWWSSTTPFSIIIRREVMVGH